MKICIWHHLTEHSFLDRHSVYHTLFSVCPTVSLHKPCLWCPCWCFGLEIFVDGFVIPSWQKVYLLFLSVANPFLFPTEQWHILKGCPHLWFGFTLPSQASSEKPLSLVRWGKRHYALLSNTGAVRIKKNRRVSGDWSETHSQARRMGWGKLRAGLEEAVDRPGSSY